MSEKVEFKGNVGQAVMGDVNEAPRLSNVVTLHVGEQEKEVELITDYQRKSINVLVKEFAALTGDDDLKIYKVFITDYGLKRFRELPRDKYHEVKASLEEWIQDAKNAAAPSKPAPPPVASHPPAYPTPHHGATSCLACAEKSASFARLQRTARMRLLALVASLAACGWLLYKVPMAADGAITPAENKCYIDGNAYSIGHTTKSVFGVAAECVPASGDSPARWANVKRGR
ncbi:hypothetical protein [Janthinobacterium fluminis]|uniref:Uncharacterized protein n=1 Tax=Janthinobacterium fluminis TaxID=2987524 RepID=A0ABT5JZ64_9BURK|nr:hypothetical protein [Janthinobacterium fluminis]MDC8757495.1 hypothetical protein [Janthinobacterium fluminis]